MEQQSAQKNNNNGDDNEDDEDVMVLGTNLVNPNIDMPHARPYCGVYSFAKDKLQFCDKCYCIKCDKPAKECDQWTQHCHEVYKKPEKKIAPSEGLQDVIDVEDTPPADSTTVTSSLLNGIDPAVQSYYASNAASLRTLAEEGLELEQAAPYHTSQHDNAYSGNFNRNQTSLHDNDYSGNLNRNRNYNDGFGHHGGRSHKDMRILEVFAQKLAGAVVQSEITPSSSPSRGVDNDDTGDDSWIAMMIEMYRNQRFDQSPMEGDIPQLKLHKSFFVEGVRIGWPFPAILPPQRQMAIHLIKALKNKRHVVLESPTGTGKSATLLCTVLAWQRWHGKITWGKPAAENRADTDNSQNMDVKDAPSNDTFPKIIYCSRTHSQVEQMVASLKKTPYRPRMTVLGSRERLCIHRNIIDRDPSNGNKTNKKRSLTNVSTECQMRRRNTERIRKDLWKCLDFLYDDNNPPDLPGDRQSGSAKEGDPRQEGDNAPEEEVEDDNSNGDDEDSPDRIMNKSKKKRTCPHFRELTTERTAEMVRSRFIPSQKEVQCCSSGSEKTSLGVHDIEDLVASGVNPYKIKVALYRGSGEGPFGFELDDNCRIKNIDSVGAAKSASLLRRGDKIIAVNGKKLQTLSDICKEVENSKDPLELTVRRPSWSRDYIRRTSERPHVLSDNSASEVLADSIVRGVDLEGGEMEDLIEVGESDTIYSPHAACPYYLSRGLARYADLIFAPYNYVLDPDIRAALGINLDGAVVVLDEGKRVRILLCLSVF